MQGNSCLISFAPFAVEKLFRRTRVLLAKVEVDSTNRVGKLSRPYQLSYQRCHRLGRKTGYSTAPLCQLQAKTPKNAYL